MMPLWIFTLGKSIFDRGQMVVPYAQIASYVYGLIIPLGIGLLIQRYCPRTARFLVRILKSCSSILIIFIVVFAIVTNLYLFKLFTWEVSYYNHYFDRRHFDKNFFILSDFYSWFSITMVGIFCRLANCSNIPSRI